MQNRFEVPLWLRPYLTKKNLIRGGVAAAITVGAAAACNALVNRQSQVVDSPVPQSGEVVPFALDVPAEGDNLLTQTPTPEPLVTQEPQRVFGSTGCEDSSYTIFVGPRTPAPYTHQPEKGVEVICKGDNTWYVKQTLTDGTIFQTEYTVSQE